jgi:acetyl-CoA C-acetyltransferase
MRDVAIIGVGLNPKWGELWDKSLRTLFTEAALAAIENAGVDHIDSMYVGCMTSGLFAGQEHLGSLMADYLGQPGLPATRVESACASGGAAVRAEKMTDVGGDGATYALSTAADADYEVYHGVTFPALYAMMAVDHMERFGTTGEDLANVAVKNHNHGSMNPAAQYPFKITVEQVLGSVMVADPLHILDCSPITDGAAAVVLCPLDKAKKLVGDRPLVKIASVGAATDSIALHHIDFAEVHDCFTIAEIMVIEALGFVDRGKGGPAARDGLTALGGKIPVNTSGGLKSKGHPVGATGAAQIIEAVTQLRGEAGDRQVEGARRGLTQNMGGTGGSSVVHILEVV